MNSMYRNLHGLTVGKLRVVSFHSMRKGYAMWNCVCECGNTPVIRSGALLKPVPTRSCGCLKSKYVKHGGSAGGRISKTYRVWSRMKERCLNPKHDNYEYYGGKGIKICDRWLESFENFRADMGEIPEGMTIERKDRDKDYCPENCIWATNIEQQNNRSNNLRLEYNGKTQTAAQWGRELGIPLLRISSRIRLGWTVQEALTTPPDPKKQYAAKCSNEAK